MSEAPPIETTESTVNPDTTSTNVAISDGAVKRLREMTAASGAALIVDEVFGDFPCVPLSDDIATPAGEFAGMMMRVSVSGGGCSGFQYGFAFDDKQMDDDHVVERDGITVLIDDMSWEFVVGSELHFAEELIGSYFVMRNPNAASTCGCGTSFSIG